jgi:hypothetical protein
LFLFFERDDCYGVQTPNGTRGSVPYGRYGFAPPPTAASGSTATGPPGGSATGPLTEPVGVGAAWLAAPDAVGPATTGPESIFAAAATGAAAIAVPDTNAARADDNANFVMAMLASPAFSCLAMSLRLR